MAIDFPDSPTNGDTFTVGDTTWEYQSGEWNLVVGSLSYTICTSSTRPASPNDGRMIYETDTNLIYVYNNDTPSWTQNNFTPVGMVSPFAGSSAPDGWLLCDGQAVSQTTYAALFAVVSTTYDVTSPGAGNFRVPDLRGRTVAGVDNMGGTAASRLTSTVLTASNTIGATGGTQTHTLSTAQLPAHSHGFGTNLVGNSSGFIGHAFAFGGGHWGVCQANNANTTTNQTGTSNTGSGSAHTNTQPTIVLNYIIKY